MAGIPEVTDLTGVNSDSDDGSKAVVCDSDSDVEIISIHPPPLTPRQCIQDAIQNPFYISPLPRKRAPYSSHWNINNSNTALHCINIDTSDSLRDDDNQSRNSPNVPPKGVVDGSFLCEQSSHSSLTSQETPDVFTNAII